MWDFLLGKQTALAKFCILRLVIVVGAIVLVLWGAGRYTSDANVVHVPPLSQEARTGAVALHLNRQQQRQQASDDTMNANAAANATDGTRIHHSIVIVGAGAAGLFAGYTLKYLGVDDFVILEAHPTVYGGRVRDTTTSTSSSVSVSASFAHVPLDLGAEWIHVQPRILQDLLLFEDDITNHNMPETIVYNPQTYDFFNRRRQKRLSRNWMRFFYSEFKFYNTTWFQYLERFVYPYVAAQLQLDTAVQRIDYTTRDGEDNRIVLTTTSALSSSQANDTPPTATTTRTTSYTADKVILAVPVTALQAGFDHNIEFVPPLPSWKQTAIDKVQMSDGMKLWLEFDQRFYADLFMPTSPFDFLRGEPLLYFDGVFRKPSTQHIVTQFVVGGPDATDRVRLTEQEAVQAALHDLDSMYNGRASLSYTGQYMVQNWSKEPFIQGAYPLNYMDYWNDMPTLRERIDDKLYFCGSFMNEEVTMVHGAALSGRRAADEVLQRFAKDQ